MDSRIKRMKFHNKKRAQISFFYLKGVASLKSQGVAQIVIWHRLGRKDSATILDQGVNSKSEDTVVTLRCRSNHHSVLTR